MARIAVDIDGVLAEKLDNGNYPEDYMNKRPLPMARESLEYLKNKGHTIILFTARHEEDREITEQWLRDHGFVYDELIMGKPYFDVLIDDRAIRHTDWHLTLHTLEILETRGRWF